MRKVANAASLVLPPSLYLGPSSTASSQSFLTANSISHVLSVGATPTHTVDGVTYHRLSLNDSPSSSISKVSDAACEIIDAALSTKGGTGKILVHCSAGISRSPTIVVAYLMKRHEMSLRSALGKVIRARPQVSPNPGFLQQLKEMEMEIFGITTLEDLEELPKREKDRLALFESLSVEEQNCK
jgi:atypical dual specificity phosphatase